MSETIKITYSAPSNITFRGEIDTEISVDEWKGMSAEEQASVVDDCIGELLDVGIKEDR